MQYDKLKRQDLHIDALCLILQSNQMEKEEIKLLSLLLATVARIHSYLSHIQVGQQLHQIHSLC